MMKTTGIKDLKSSLRETLEQVKAGETVIVTERGEPIARIVPIETEEERMARLVRTGVLRPPLRPLDDSVWKLQTEPLFEDPEGRVLTELLRQRGSHR
jgi:prevent-host-death family protein